MTDGVKITIGKNNGIMDELLKHVYAQVKASNATLTDGYISNGEKYNAISVIDKINEERKSAKLQTIFSGGNKTDDWHKNFVVYEGQEINFTEAEITRIYDALGVSFTIQQNDVKKTDDLLDNNAQLDSLALQNKEQITNLNDTLNTEQEQEADVGDASKKKSNSNGKGGLIALGVLTAAVLLFATRGKIKKAFKNIFKISPNPKAGMGCKAQRKQLAKYARDRRIINKINYNNALERAEVNTIGNLNHAVGSTESMTAKVYAAAEEAQAIRNGTKAGTKILKINGDTYEVTINNGKMGKLMRQIGNGEFNEITDPVKRAKFEATHFDQIFDVTAA